MPQTKRKTRRRKGAHTKAETKRAFVSQTAVAPQATWTIAGLALVVETRTCNNCGRSYECPPSHLMVKAKAYRGSVRRLTKPMNDLLGELSCGHHVERQDVATSIAYCHNCIDSRTALQDDFFQQREFVPNVPRQFRGDTILSGAEEPPQKVEEKPKNIPSLEDF